MLHPSIPIYTNYHEIFTKNIACKYTFIHFSSLRISKTSINEQILVKNGFYISVVNYKLFYFS